MVETKRPKEEEYSLMGIMSLPRDDRGFLNEREIINLCGKAKMPFEYLYDLHPYEFMFYVEGYLEDQREYFEYMNYSLFSAIRQALGKGKKFENPFEKKQQAEQRKLTEDEYESEVDALKEIFNL